VQTEPAGMREVISRPFTPPGDSISIFLAWTADHGRTGLTREALISPSQMQPLQASLRGEGYMLQRAETKREIDGLNEEKQRRHDEEKSAQASRVAYWITRGHAEWHVSGANTSGLPIFNLVLRMYGDDPKFSIAVTRGTQGPDDVGRSRKLANVLETILAARDALDVNPSKVHLDIAFTDAAGTRWLRTEDGKLQAVNDDFEFENVDERLVDRLVPLRPKA